MRHWLRPLIRLLLALATGYCMVSCVAGLFQNQLIYFPATAPEKALRAAATEAGLEPWREAAGAIIGWKTPEPASPGNRLIVFHGNGGFALHRDYFVHLPPDPATWEVFLFEYPGYGSREGSPGEKAIKNAASAAFAGLRDRQGRNGRTFLAGESLGTGVAAWLAGQRPDDVAGLLLVTPMTNLPDVAGHHYPWLPVSLLLTERYDSVSALKSYRGPVAVVVAGRDEVVPPEFGRRLFESYNGPKRFWEQPDATHNTVNYLPRRWAPVFEFLTHGERR